MFNQRLYRPLGLTVLLLVGLALSGCNIFGFIANLGGEWQPATYNLPERTTLIMIDDPDRQLGDRMFSHNAGAHAARLLDQNDVVPELVAQEELAALASRIGTDFDRMPIDQVGQELGAEVVVHVLVENVHVSEIPRIYRPTAELEVKVIDAEAGRRLFPDPGQLDDPTVRKPGHSMTIEMEYETADVPGRDVEITLLRGLSERIGRDVARLFYRHRIDMD